ncbi:MAG: DUF1669 domain-containing protein [Cytophagales bacterium]|nr:MAG: DUF1669 domain-containing protein [Cytophagales bacterium]
MEIKPYFKDIRRIILQEIDNSKKNIQIAVAWFTNYELFDILCNKLSEGINVELIIVDDEINNRIGGLYFQKFINLGGKLYYGNDETPMHHKFCVIDDNVLITGSYNWTYLAENINSENITVFKGTSDILEGFKTEFLEIKSKLSAVKHARQNDVITQNFKSKFDIKNYLATDIYQYALKEQSLGNNQNALNLINFSLNLKPNDEQLKTKRFEIRTVIYKKWNEDYIIDKIDVTKEKSIFYFRTHIKDCGEIYSPNLKYAWKLRNTQNMGQILNCTVIKNITLNGKVIEPELFDVSILFINTLEHSITSGKYTLENINKIFDKSGIKFLGGNKGIDEKGRNVKIIEYRCIKDTEMTCEIHFPSLNDDINFVDLLEGIEAIDRSNHWHCFDIEINRNKESKV